MDKDYLVSVIMPAYNAEKFIDDSINSILKQSYKHIELIILNDASTDTTEKIVLKYKNKDKRIKYYKNETNLGYVKSFNKLLDLCNGHLITSQDADDYSHFDRIQLQLNAFLSDRKLDVCGTNYFRISEKGKVLEKTEFPTENKELRACSPPYAPFHGSSMMIKKDVAKKYGKYDEFFHRKGGDDVYWAYFLIDNFYTINLKEHLYYYRANPKGVTLNFKSLEEGNIGQVVTFLIKQRRKEGSDYLQRKNFKALNKYLSDINKPYKEDTLLFAKEQLFRNIWTKNFVTSLKILLYIIKKEPKQPINFYRSVFSNFKNNI